MKLIKVTRIYHYLDPETREESWKEAEMHLNPHTIIACEHLEAPGRLRLQLIDKHDLCVKETDAKAILDAIHLP